MFPFLRPFVPQPPQPPQPPVLPTGNQAHPAIDAIAQTYNPYGYMFDEESLDELDEFNDRLSEQVAEVAELEETEAILKSLIDLDKRRKTAQTGIHKSLSAHQQFLAKNQNALQAIRHDYQLGIAGLNRERVVQQSQFDGIVTARERISQRLRGN